MARKIDFLLETAKKKFHLPDDWTWFRWERQDANGRMFHKITGAVCREYYTRGKRKGAPNWRKRDKSTELVVVVAHKDVKAFEARWSKRTGLCSRCQGTGQAWAGWSADSGTRYKTCPPCSGTGKSAPTTHEEP